ncbi:hypothetical protein A3D04_03930 [Candidatus Curtissbacteria bacterium RIFCSPHIGHO2_02_FULL_40_16b]|uniref:Glycosyltransferase RgtA/B/C/D-like domain-containing protein n=1 Tax=Candidatus Curtissbacteria bacterium RIFCSPHIGHO2_02_FULL_40_16b TaxID=1797714 RepID=A0A1F5GBX2_9BACT|nr:MAG: hypothetical protein A3D04_03930 [Candidatus Curtissbacteria bacterium RIFCSPHIGHO2_02_FULL_40_16b]
MKSKIPIFLVLVAALFVRIYLIVRDSVPFAYDMGRDLLWAKDISFYHIPTLIGPAASIWGVYFGPLWYYFLSIPLLISGGHPLSAVFFTASTIILTGALAYFLFFKYIGKQLAFILAIIILFSAALINISTFAFHANLLPLLTLLTIYFSFLAIVKNPLCISLSFLFVSLMFHADPAPAVVFTFFPIIIFIIFKLYKKRPVQTLLSSLVLYLVPFLPQILFELRNDFIQTKSLIAYFSGNNPSLSGQLPVVERFFNRIKVFFEFFTSSFSPENILLSTVLIILIIFGAVKINTSRFKNELKILFNINLTALILSFLIFTFPITVEIKTWYLYGLPIVFAFQITLAIVAIRKFHKLIPIFIIVFLLVNLKPLLFRNSEALKSDPALLSNQIEAIKFIESDSEGIDYTVYVYTPTIYDYSYQYLFWWQGKVKKIRFPQEFAYLPGQPSYVRNKNFYTVDPEETDIVYLIIEENQENEFYTKENWLKNFESYQLAWENNINGAIKIQKREK